MTETTRCRVCEGRGNIADRACPFCDGDGFTKAANTSAVSVSKPGKSLTTAPTWHYRVERLNEHKPFEDQVILDKHGREGYELVAVRGVYAYFKKPGVSPLA
jgi:hypothetical protein